MIRLSSISKIYRNNNINNEVLKRIDLKIHKGDMVCLMGSSGTGKSTLLNILAGLTSVTSGEYYFNGEVLEVNNHRTMEKFRREQLGIVLQHFALIEDLTVFQNIALPLKYQRIAPKEIERRTKNILEELKLMDKYRNYPDELSGGQQQRVAIARALVKKPDIIIADEPTGALDDINTEKVLDIFKEINSKGLTVIIATHDAFVAEKCNRRLLIKGGQMFEQWGEGYEAVIKC